MSRLDWSHADSDIARILYESVIAADERRWLGEQYTRARLARGIVDTLVPDPPNHRVLDPARGLGTVTFAGVRTYLAADRSDAANSVAQVLPEVRAEREDSGRGFTVTTARRELRRWLSESEEGLVGRLLG